MAKLQLIVVTMQFSLWAGYLTVYCYEVLPIFDTDTAFESIADNDIPTPKFRCIDDSDAIAGTEKLIIRGTATRCILISGLLCTLP